MSSNQKTLPLLEPSLSLGRYLFLLGPTTSKQRFQGNGSFLQEHLPSSWNQQRLNAALSFWARLVLVSRFWATSCWTDMAFQSDDSTSSVTKDIQEKEGRVDFSDHRQMDLQVHDTQGSWLSLLRNRSKFVCISKLCSCRYCLCTWHSRFAGHEHQCLGNVEIAGRFGKQLKTDFCPLAADCRRPSLQQGLPIRFGRFGFSRTVRKALMTPPDSV